MSPLEGPPAAGHAECHDGAVTTLSSRPPVVRLTRLTLNGFRNLSDQTLALPKEGVVIVGQNAQGKTNLLEAIYYLETFRSFRGARDDALIRLGEDWFRVAGDLEADGGHEVARSSATSVAAAFQAQGGEGRTKRISVDGQAVSRMSEAIGALGAVLFTPEDVRLVSDGPRERRRFLDILLSLNEPGYLDALQRFRQALTQRNAVLRKGGGAPEVAAWNELIVQSGAHVSWARWCWARASDASFGLYHSEVSAGEAARLRYDPSIPRVSEAIGPDEVAETYRRALDRVRDQERRRAVTLVGPHRDELRFFLGGSVEERDVREFGSGGQRRTVALALRLLEADTIRRCRRTEPLLLLDDAFAELDATRSRKIVDMLDRSSPGQVVLTVPKESDIQLRGGSLVRWSIRSGEVTT